MFSEFKKLLLFSFSIGFFNIIHAQKIQYTPLRCAGEIPKDFLESSSKKIISKSESINKQTGLTKNKKHELNYVKNSIFLIDEILFSGKVLYGDVLTTHVNNIADDILKDDKELRNKLRFYVLKSKNVNAFSTHEGIIFVTIGLLTQIENDAQLAFILCHEISHFTENHNLNSYINNQNIKRSKGKYASLNLEEKIQSIYDYSKENELEADAVGYKLFLKSKYSTKAIIPSFDMLLFSHMPYDELEWSAKILEDSLYKFSPKLLNAKEGKITSKEDEDDENSTHPNVKTRKENIAKIINKNEPNRENSTFYFKDKEFFQFIQKQARIELFFIMMNLGEYTNLYYHTYIFDNLYKEDSAFTKLIKTYSIYGLASNKLNLEDFLEEYDYLIKKYKLSDIMEKIESDEEYEGSFNAVSYFFNKITKNELLTLNVRTSWQSFKNNEENKMAKEFFFKSIYLLFRYSDFDTEEFKSFSVNKDTTSTMETEVKDDETLTKSEKLKLKQKKQKDPDSKTIEELYYKAFIYFFKDLKFEKYFDSIANIAKNDKNENNIEYLLSISENNGIESDTLILLNSFFNSKIHNHSSYESNIMKEENVKYLSELHKSYAENNKFTISPLNIYDRENLTTEILNEYSQIMEWLTEKLNCNLATDLTHNKYLINNIINENNTKYIMLNGVSYATYKKEVNFSLILLSVLVYPTLPFTIAYYLTKKKVVRYYSYIYNLENGALCYSELNSYRGRYSKNMIKSHIYTRYFELNKLFKK